MYHLLRKTTLYALYSLKRADSQLSVDGWFKSRSVDSIIDAQGAPLPWYSYPAIRFLSQRISPHFTIYEFGCGQSTIWWAHRAKEVITCEHDPAWYKKILHQVPQNVSLQLLCIDNDEYARSISNHRGLIDIAIIDGRDRVNCAKYSADALKPNGVIIWDNSDRTDQYMLGFKMLASKGFKRIDFYGMAPLAYKPTQTSIFYKDNNCLHI